MIRLIFKEKVPIILSSVILFLGLSYNDSLKKPFIVEELTQQPIIAKQGDKIVVCRDLTYITDANIKISRHMVMHDKELGLDRSVQIDKTIASTPRAKGYEINLCREVIIPRDISYGKWILWTHVEVHTFPFWNNTFKILPLDVEVVKDK